MKLDIRKVVMISTKLQDKLNKLQSESRKRILKNYRGVRK